MANRLTNLAAVVNLVFLLNASLILAASSYGAENDFIRAGL